MKLEKLKWNHDSDYIEETFGFSSVDEIKKESMRRFQEENDASLIIATSLVSYIIENRLFMYIGALIYPDQVRVPSELAEIIYNLIVKNYNSDKPLIDDTDKIAQLMLMERVDREKIIKSIIAELEGML